MYGDAVGRWRSLKLTTDLLVLEVFVMFENRHFSLLYGKLRSMVKRASVEDCLQDDFEALKRSQYFGFTKREFCE